MFYIPKHSSTLPRLWTAGLCELQSSECQFYYNSGVCAQCSLVTSLEVRLSDPQNDVGVHNFLWTPAKFDQR